MKSLSIVIGLVMSLITFFVYLKLHQTQEETIIVSNPKDNGILQIKINQDSLATVLFVYNKDTVQLKGLYKEDLIFLGLFLYDDARKQIDTKLINFNSNENQKNNQSQ